MKKGFIQQKFHKRFTTINAQFGRYARYFKQVCALCVVACFGIAQANTLDSKSSANQAKSAPQENAPKIEIRGNTIVIQDSACGGKSKSLLSSLQGNQSSQSLATQECEDDH